MFVQQSSLFAAEFGPVHGAAAVSRSAAASGAARRFILSSSSLSPGRTRSLTACNLNFGKKGNSPHSVQRFSSFAPPAAPALVRRDQPVTAADSNLFFLFSFFLLHIHCHSFLYDSRWLLFGKVSWLHTRGSWTTEVRWWFHTTTLSLLQTSKNQRLQQISSGCKTNVCVRVFGGAGGVQMFSLARVHNGCFVTCLLTGAVTWFATMSLLYGVIFRWKVQRDYFKTWYFFLCKIPTTTKKSLEVEKWLQTVS